jgi:glycosyltransferase involved in cell wall biosynthesis
MKELPLISVLMPVYNAEQYLSEAIESILNQTYSNFEFLIFNDGSQDSSREIIKKYRDRRIKLFDYEKNSGYVRHLNYGIKFSNGEFIARMDADDICYPERFEKQINYLNEHNECDICGSWFKTIGLYEKEIKYPVTHEEIQLELLSGCPMGHPTVILRKKFIAKNHLKYDENYCPSEDYELWSRMSFMTRMYNFPEILLNYRIHNVQTSLLRENISNQKFEQARDIYLRSFCSKISSNTKLIELGRLFSEKISLDKIKHYESLAFNCIEENAKSGQYNSVNLKYSFGIIYRDLCLRYSHFSPLAMKTFLSSPLSRYGYFGPKFLKKMVTNYLFKNNGDK